MYPGGTGVGCVSDGELMNLWVTVECFHPYLTCRAPHAVLLRFSIFLHKFARMIVYFADLVDKACTAHDALLKSYSSHEDEKKKKTQHPGGRRL